MRGLTVSWWGGYAVSVVIGAECCFCEKISGGGVIRFFYCFAVLESLNVKQAVYGFRLPRRTFHWITVVIC